MAINTQRLMIMVLAINIIISVASAIYDNPTIFDENTVSNTINIGEVYSGDVSSEGSLQQPESFQQEGTFGSALRMGGKVVGLLVRGMNPFQFTDDTFTDPLDKMMARGLMLFRIFMYIIIGIEIFMLIKNRKTS